MKYFLSIIFLLFIFSTSCKHKDLIIENVAKTSESDVFRNTLVESQIIRINASEDNVIESNNGNLIIIPKGSFINKRGKIVNDSIEVELAEANDIDELIFSNLVIQDTINQYEQFQAYFINAKRKGQQLGINPDKPIYIELPANKIIELHKGNRNEKGNMSWNNIIKPIEYLVPVPLESIDFLPPKFESEVEKGLPFRNHEVATKDLLDSLYYSFTTELNDSGYSIIKTGKILCMINVLAPILRFIYQEEELHEATEQYDSSETTSWGINPASIKALQNKKFQNTLISTREFETRLRTIFATCNNDILELYINNLDKNLWEIDEMAAKELGVSHQLYSKFMEFASYKQTTIILSDRKAEILANHYKKSKKKIAGELLKLKEEFLADKKSEKEITEKKLEDYKSLLADRQKYRMQKFGFELTEFGWYNAVHKIKLEGVEKFELNIKIDNGELYDRVFAYVIDQRINSIFSCLSNDNVHFDYVYQEDPNLLLMKGQNFKIIGVGYKNEIIGSKLEEFKQQKIVDAQIELEEIALKDFKKGLRDYTRGYKKENRIIVDLEYQAFFYQKQKQKEREQAEKEFLDNLRRTVFPCNNERRWGVLTEKQYLDQFGQ